MAAEVTWRNTQPADSSTNKHSPAMTSFRFIETTAGGRIAESLFLQPYPGV
jgi:hypothetical protein